MNLLKLAIYEVLHYGPLLWLAFIVIALCSARYVGWLGVAISSTVIAAIILFLDVEWIWDQMTHHPEEGRDADMIFAFGVLLRILLFNILLVPVSCFGVWRRRVARDKKSRSRPTSSPQNF